MNFTNPITITPGQQSEIPLSACHRLIVLQAPGPLTYQFPDGAVAAFQYPGAEYLPPRDYGMMLNGGSLLVSCDTAGVVVLGLLDRNERLYIPAGSCTPFTPPFAFPTSAASIVLVETSADNITIPVLGFTRLSIMALYNINPANQIWVAGQLDAQNFTNGYPNWSTAVNPPLSDFKGVVYDDGTGAHSILANRTITEIYVTPFTTVRFVLRNTNPGDTAMMSYKMS
jgi:hypothetical protein